MARRSLRALVPDELSGPFFFTVVAMGPLATIAILALRAVHLAAQVPLWVIPTFIVCGQVLTTATGVWFIRSPTRLRLHAKMAAHAGVVAATIYATGWGPALAIGLVLVGQETLTSAGPSAQSVVLGWELAGLVVGEIAIALGWAPSLIAVPQVHGLAVLTGIAIVFSCRALLSALVEKEAATTVTEQQERKFRALLQSSHDLVFVVDASSSVTYASPSCAQVLGYDASRLLGPDQSVNVHPDDIDGLRAAMQHARATDGGCAPLLCRIRRADDTWCWVEGVATNLFEDPAVAGMVVNLRDVTERVLAEDAVRHQALHDPLTGLANRSLFADRLEHATGRASRKNRYVAAMIVDLDGFKNVNDSLGHAVGDELLIATAERLGGALRASETIARLGGDEFAILIEDIEAPEQVLNVARRLLDSLAAPIAITDREVTVSASIGIAIIEATSDATDRILGQADAAMYRAKREGKGCYRVFEESMHAAAVQRLELEQALRAAVVADVLDVHYQPIVDLHTGTVSGFEALARWKHPEYGSVPPDRFIPIAEETNLIVDLGHNILVHACQQASRWRTRYPHLDLNVAVNVSQRQLTDPNLLDRVSTAVETAGLPATALVVEITESVLADDSGRVVGTLDQLRRMGIRVAIDDFGTGYSSLAALAELPIDILKIDKRFIDNVATSHRGRGMVNAIIRLAHTLGLETIAEGVEVPEQHDALRELGTTHLQGYVHSLPLTAELADHYLVEHVRASTVDAPALRTAS